MFIDIDSSCSSCLIILAILYIIIIKGYFDNRSCLINREALWSSTVIDNISWMIHSISTTDIKSIVTILCIWDCECSCIVITITCTIRNCRRQIRMTYLCLDIDLGEINITILYSYSSCSVSLEVLIVLGIIVVIVNSDYWSSLINTKVV